MTVFDWAISFSSLDGVAERPRRLSLALQGGGSFGAFTWGVLDRLLEEPSVALDAISGASAGAVNAALLTAGLIEGGRTEAKARLERFWKRMSDLAAFLPSADGSGLGFLARKLSPALFNPLNLNPMREALLAEVDFASLRERSPLKLLVAATRVRDGALRIFTEEELTIESLLASACLPLVHHTIEVDGEPYWDGGYVANPPLIPLVLASETPNILVVQVTPTHSERLPTTVDEIRERLEQIRFNSSLNAELEALRLCALRAPRDSRRLRIDRISAQDEFEGLDRESAGNLAWSFLLELHRSGRNAVETWLGEAAPEERPALRPRVGPLPGIDDVRARAKLGPPAKPRADRRPGWARLWKRALVRSQRWFRGSASLRSFSRLKRRGQ